MSDNGQGGGYGLWTVVTVVLIVVGLIYLISLINWFIHWGVIALAIGGTGYVVYRIARGMPAKKTLPAPQRAPKKLLASESPFDKRLRELESENAKLKKLLADKLLEVEAMKDVLSKKW